MRVGRSIAKVTSVADWRRHFHDHPWAFVAAAAGAGLALAVLIRSGRGRLAAAAKASTPPVRYKRIGYRPNRHPIDEGWDLVKRALVGVAATKVRGFLRGADRSREDAPRDRH